MILRLVNLIKSLKTAKRINETKTSTTIDDMKEGERITFDPERVRELMEKCDLLEKIE